MPDNYRANTTPYTTDELRGMTIDELHALHADPTNCSCVPSLEGRSCDLHIILNRRIAGPWWSQS